MRQMDKLETHKLRDTRIPQGGVLRCCLATVGREYYETPTGLGTLVSIGAQSTCKHCGERFTLVAANPNPIWESESKIKQGGAR